MRHFAVLSSFLVFYSLSVLSAVVEASQAQEVIFVVDKMTCAACPITVSKAMQRVDGVSEVAVDLESKSVAVKFDPDRTNAEQIAEASNKVGFPAVIHKSSTP
jgi:mercuric ion binding protein